MGIDGPCDSLHIARIRTQAQKNREIVGDDATEALISKFGSGYVYIPLPENLAPDHPLAKAIGLDDARALCREWGGLRVPIPSGHRQRIAKRNARIQALYEGGASVPALAREFGVTPRAIYNVIVPRGARKSSQAAAR
jgi:hypothetical protein